MYVVETEMYNDIDKEIVDRSHHNKGNICADSDPAYRIAAFTPQTTNVFTRATFQLQLDLCQLN